MINTATALLAYGSALISTVEDSDETIYLGDEATDQDVERVGEHRLRGKTNDTKPLAFIDFIDITRGGAKTFAKEAQPQPYQEEDIVNMLPDLACEGTRIILAHSLNLQPSWPRSKLPVVSEIFNSPQKAGVTLGSNLIHDQGDVLSQSSFRDVQTRTLNVWDVQNLWSPSLNHKSCPLYVQTNLKEKFVDGHHKLRESIHSSRRVLFFGRHTMEYWECISTVQTRFGSDGRAESVSSLGNRLCPR